MEVTLRQTVRAGRRGVQIQLNRLPRRGGSISPVQGLLTADSIPCRRLFTPGIFAEKCSSFNEIPRTAAPW